MELKFDQRIDGGHRCYPASSKEEFLESGNFVLTYLIKVSCALIVDRTAVGRPSVLSPTFSPQHSYVSRNYRTNYKDTVEDIHAFLAGSSIRRLF